MAESKNFAVARILGQYVRRDINKAAAIAALQALDYTQPQASHVINFIDGGAFSQTDALAYLGVN